MASERPDDARDSDDLATFLNTLNELKATGCNLLVVGDARRELFTRASANLLGEADALRYRLLAVTDAAPGSVAERLPDADETPRPLAATTRVVNHASMPRSVTAASGSTETELGPSAQPHVEVPETDVSDSDLDELRAALVGSIDEFADRKPELRPARLRVGVDSLGTLLDRHGHRAVSDWLGAVGTAVTDHDAMAHYVLRDPYDAERVQALTDDVDAIIEVRSVRAAEYGHDAQQRWHVPDRDVTTDWVRL